MFESQQGTCYRISLHPGGPDPRDALQNDTALSPQDSEAIRSKLVLIEASPGVVSTELAERIGLGRADFKDRVRKLKALGLTISLDVGYRLSPRGDAVLKRG